MTNEPTSTVPDVNPANGLPMVEDTYLDVEGNAYGTDQHTWQSPYDPGYDYMPQPSGFDPW